ncbi:MAG: methyltransferase domain-containing protein [Pseudonocardia sp.]|nr:methyltransferase domain-containing protein [Pseudonocardia sp.]
MSTAADHYDQVLAPHYSWMLGGDITALAADQARLLADLGITPSAEGATAIDLGCGPGNQTLALAALGFTRVLAVDSSGVLLDELAAHADENPAIQPVHADLRGVLRKIAEPASAAVIVCMGDTLTHLPDKADVTVLLGDVERALAGGGALVITYRDLSRPLLGPDRFIPVRHSADQLLTCFLEYLDDDTVLVHDLLHTRSDGEWTQQVGSYPKLRLGAGWLADQCHAAGLGIRRDEVGPGGMRVLHAVKPKCDG